jgi:glycosyltransferase involved in cell wall biosynthesis
MVHSNSLHSWYGFAAAAIVRRPHLWHAREIVVQSDAALRLERRLCRTYADTVVAVSEAVAAQLDRANVVVCYDQVDPDEFHPRRAGHFRPRLGLTDDAVVVGVAGRIDTWKGIEVLLDAVPELQRRRPGLEVVVAGGPVAGNEEYASRLAARAAALAGVHWLGARDDMAELIADLDVLVLPSTEPEPFGLAVIEALASGVPVVASAAGGPLEILGADPSGAGTGASAGRLVSPGNPSELAAAVIELLPPGPSSTSQRRQRPVLQAATPAGNLPAVFEAVLNASRESRASHASRGSGKRRRRGTGSSSRRRSDPR